MKSPNDILYDIGFAPPGANVRSKPANYFDTLTIAAGVQTYPLFNSPVINPAIRNKQFPQSDSEIFFLTDITGFSSRLFNGNAATAIETGLYLMESYLEIIVGDRQVLKIPALEFLNLIACDNNGVLSSNWRKIINQRNLRYPIIFNASEQITINFVTNAVSAVTLNGFTMRIEFCGFKYDKIEYFSKEFAQAKDFNIINYSIYDVQTLAVAATNYTLFNNANKALTLYSKTLPAATGETFTAEAIEICWTTILNTPDVVYQELDQIQLTINVNDVLFYQGNAQTQISLIASQIQVANTFTFMKRRNFILPEPIVFGSNQKSLITLVQPAVTALSAAPFIAILKGTLTRSKV